MTSFLWGLLLVILVLLGHRAVDVLADMISEEMRSRLDHLPHAILGLARRKLPPGQRATVCDAEWMPELEFILKEEEGRPVTRLVAGTRYALGLLRTTRRIARHLHRPALESPPPAPPGPSRARARFTESLEFTAQLALPLLLAVIAAEVWAVISWIPAGIPRDAVLGWLAFGLVGAVLSAGLWTVGSVSNNYTQSINGKKAYLINCAAATPLGPALGIAWLLLAAGRRRRDR